MANWWDEDPAPSEAQGAWWEEDEPAEAAPVVSRETPPAQAGSVRWRPESQIPELTPELAGEAAQRLDDIVRGVADVFTFGTADEIAAAAQAATGVGTIGLPQGQDYETALAQERARDEASNQAARLMGNAAGGLTLGGVVGAPRTLGQAVLQGTGLGAAMGFGSGEGGFKERLKSSGFGAMVGGPLSGAAYGLSNVVAPQIGPALRALREEGVRPTVGQMAGGAVGRLEEGAQSIPLVGSMIRNARTRALEDFNRGAINHVLRPAGLQISPKIQAGRPAIAEANRLIGKSYDDILDTITDARVDQRFAQDIARITAEAQDTLGDAGRRAFTNALEDVTSLPAMQRPTFSGREIKRAVTGLREDADRLMARQDEDVYQAGRLIREARDALSDLLKRNTTPGNAAQLTGLDRAYAGFNSVRDASIAGRDGIFTPFQLSQAIKKADKALKRRTFARGDALGQEFASAADEIISSRVPDSGTPERLAPFMVGGAAGAGYIDPVAGSLAAAAVTPYTRLGQNMLAALARPAPSRGAQMLAEQFRRSALPLAAVGTAATTE